MPYIKDFSALRGRGSFELEVPRWTDLTIEYGYDYISNQMYLYWRLLGTKHTFKISYYDMVNMGHEKIEEYIAQFLRNFRLEYLGWAAGGFTEEWMREYHEEYKHFIEL
jgi:hypothetical protein